MAQLIPGKSQVETQPLIKLDDEEMRVLRKLSSVRAISPSQLAAELMIYPDVLKRILHELTRVGLALMMRDEAAPDGRIVFLTSEGWEYITKSETSI